ncbi:hypothetical protein V8B97DRAFT_1330287 [Scleroderma yunnanense]
MGCIAEIPSAVPIKQGSSSSARSVNQDMSSRNRGSDPVRKHSAIACRFYHAGYCRRGLSCPFSHIIKADVSHTNKSQFPVIQNIGFSPEQPPPYYPPNPHILPFYPWPSSCTTALVSVGPHESPLLSTVGVDYAIFDDHRDSEMSSTHACAFDRDVHNALEALNHNGSSGSPVSSISISSRRPSLAAPYRDPAGVAGTPFPDWMSYLTWLNATADWYGGISPVPPLFAQSHIQSVSSYQDQLKRKPFAYQSM